jgi:hypothetical protein
MTFRPSKRVIKGLWNRGWFRRITYVLIAGGTCVGASLWTVRQPFFHRWLIGKLDTLVRDETGLSLQAEALEFHLLEGRVVLRKLSVGGDLMKADRLEVQADLATLFGRSPHLWNIELENPDSILNAARLAKIKLKHHPISGSTPQIRLDRLTIYGGKLKIQEPAWQLPNAEFTYRVYGQGLGPNRLYADIRVPRFVLGEGPGSVDGSFSAKANLSDLSLELKEGEARVGNSHLQASGNYAFKERILSSAVNGTLDLAEVLKLADPKAANTWTGVAEFKAGVRGAVNDPSWSLSARGKGLRSRTNKLLAGDAAVTADGNLRQANIRNLEWISPQGKLQASGQWTRGFGSQLHFHGEQFGLAPLAAFARAGFLESLSVNLEGNAELPGDPWVPPQLDQVKVDADGHFLKANETVGQFRVQLSGGELALDKVDLKVPEVALEGRGSLKLGKRNLQSVSAQAAVSTDAGLVSEVLQSWDIGEGHADGKTLRLGMSGQAKAQADLEWDVAQGVRLKGHVDVEMPKWHGATMDRLQADVSIHDRELRVEGIEAEKNAGSVRGSLWLTWRDVAPGQDQMDMGFQAIKLPIEEGLRAGDVGDLPITGMGSGWAHIHGPYDHLLVEAGGTAEGAHVYGFAIPFASGDMVYDITGDHLEIKDARVAETAEQLGSPEEEPAGLLALHGGMDMDLKRATWKVWAKGNVDSKPLDIPGPRFQARVDARFGGPWVSAFGPLQLPSGTVDFDRGRLFLDQQGLEGFEGHLESGTGALHLEVGTTGKPARLLTLQAWAKGTGVTGAAEVHIGPDSADTAHLAARLTRDLLKDGGLDLAVQGSWDGSNLRWQGHLENLAGHFDGFDLVQQQPAILQGNAAGLSLDLTLQGMAMARPNQPVPLNGNAAAFQVSGQVPFSASKPMALKLQGAAELANLKGILDHVLEVDEYSLLGDMKPQGNAQFDLNLGGPYSAPTLDGELSLTAGRLQIRTFPQSVEDLSFKVRFKDHDIFLSESEPLRGRLAQGTLKAWGTATWEFGGISVYDLQAHLDDFQFRDLPEGFELYGSLEAALQGTRADGGILSGTIWARHMMYQADINLRDLILASAVGGSSLLGTDPNDPFSHIDLDLNLILSQPWEFDTNLLKLQGRPTGAFRILGTLAEPGLKGKMDILPGGRLTNLLPAGDVVLERGSIEWTNPQIRYPILDLQGRVDVPPYVVNLAIRGNLDGLEMKQSSTPSLRQDEITAILIDPSQAPTIGSTAGPASQTAINSGLANTGSGLVTTLALANFQESLRRTLNLDRVNVAWRTGSGTGAPETSVTVGKSINLFGHPTPLVLSHQKSGDTTTTSGQVEWRFGNFVLLLGVSQSGQNGAAPSGEIRHTWSPGW